MLDDKEAEEFINKYYKTIFCFCLSKIGYDFLCAEEITNLIFSHCLNAVKSITDNSDVLSVLFSMADESIELYKSKISI